MGNSSEVELELDIVTYVAVITMLLSFAVWWWVF